MIKLNDFAKNKGVTTQAIYKHINKHKADLENHIERRGKNGTWFDDYACAYISKLMISNPIVVAEGEQQTQISQLESENSQLKSQIIELQAKLLNATNELNLSQSSILLIKASESNLEQNVKQLSNDLNNAQNRLKDAYNKELEKNAENIALNTKINSLEAELLLSKNQNVELGKEIESVKKDLEKERHKGFFARLFNK